MSSHRADQSSSYETFTETVLPAGKMPYSMPNVRQEYRTVPLDGNTALWMRGPGFATASFVIESAMDERAHKLGIDPIELRQRNEPNEDESSGLAFSTRRLRKCYNVGAREFGWHRRASRPRTRCDGDWLIGMGMATDIYETQRHQAQARVRLNADGRALVEAAASDMGPGTYTSQTQVAADGLGLSMRAVAFRLRDSLDPQTPPHGGSMAMASVCSAVLDGCNQVRRQAIKLAAEDPQSSLHRAVADDIVVRNGRLHLNCSSILPAAKRTNGYSPATTSPTSKHSEPSRNPPSPRATPSAPTTPPLPRSPSTRRWAWYGCGASSGLRRRTIISPQLTERQAIGGITGGIGTALLEHTVTDHRDGRIVNANLADYLVHDKGRHPAKDIGAAAWGTSTCCACTSPIPPTWPR